MLGFGVYLKYKKSQLSNFTQWKNMGKGDYVAAMEPCNGPPIGRAAARELGILKFIEAGEVRRLCREAGILVGVGGSLGNVVRLQPPLVITEEECARVLETLETVLADTARAL